MEGGEAAPRADNSICGGRSGKKGRLAALQTANDRVHRRSPCDNVINKPDPEGAIWSVGRFYRT